VHERLEGPVPLAAEVDVVVGGAGRQLTADTQVQDER
jgi:hypothetical protein